MCHIPCHCHQNCLLLRYFLNCRHLSLHHYRHLLPHRVKSRRSRIHSLFPVAILPPEILRRVLLRLCSSREMIWIASLQCCLICIAVSFISLWRLKIDRQMSLRTFVREHIRCIADPLASFFPAGNNTLLFVVL